MVQNVPKITPKTISGSNSPSKIVLWFCSVLVAACSGLESRGERCSTTGGGTSGDAFAAHFDLNISALAHKTVTKIYVRKFIFLNKTVYVFQNLRQKISISEISAGIQTNSISKTQFSGSKIGNFSRNLPEL